MKLSQQTDVCSGLCKTTLQALEFNETYSTVSKVKLVLCYRYPKLDSRSCFLVQLCFSESFCKSVTYISNICICDHAGEMGRLYQVQELSFFLTTAWLVHSAFRLMKWFRTWLSIFCLRASYPSILLEYYRLLSFWSCCSTDCHIFWTCDAVCEVVSFHCRWGAPLVSMLNQRMIG